MILQQLLLATSASAASWTYSNQAAWDGECKTSKNQSPIDIISSTAVKKHSKDDPITADSFVASVFPGKHKVTLNNVTSDDTHSVTWNFVKPYPGNDKFHCPQYHCHFDVSEHSLDGMKHFGECHVVCMQKKFAEIGDAAASKETDALAVFGFMIGKGDANTKEHAVVQQMLDSKKDFKDMVTQVEIEIPATAKLAEGYWRYNGGLTTPKCNELVTWTVFKNVQYMSEKQYNEFMTWKDGNLRGNDRQVQPMNGRTLTFYSSSAAQMMASIAIVVAMIMF